jgi:hypothetical protein
MSAEEPGKGEGDRRGKAAVWSFYDFEFFAGAGR